MQQDLYWNYNVFIDAKEFGLENKNKNSISVESNYNYELNFSNTFFSVQEMKIRTNRYSIFLNLIVSKNIYEHDVHSKLRKNNIIFL